jgi:hypothetical protein
MYGLPKTGITMMTVGGVAVARPLLAVGIAIALITVGVVLRITGNRKALAQ